MKKINLVILILCSVAAFATHNRSAEILYKRIAPFSSYTYSITIIRYTDSGQSIADRCQDTLNFGDGQKAVIQRINGVPGSCDCSACGEIIISDPGYTVKRNVYSTIHTYTTAGTYIVSSKDPNRNGGIINIPNSVNQVFYVESVIVVSPAIAANSSPVLSNLPADKGLVGISYFHHPGAYDEDGDSLSYEIVACKSSSNQTLPGYVFPAYAPGGSFSISPTTGLLNWTSPQQLGEFNIAILVKEWRKINCTGSYQVIGSVTRDMQVLIGNAASASISISSITDTCIVAGTLFNKTFTVTASSQTKLTLLGSAVNSALATLYPVTGINTFNSSFMWNTSCSQVQNNSHQIVYYAELNNTPRQKIYNQFNLKIVPLAPEIISVTTPTNHVILTWKKVSACNNIKGYYIYRKNGSNSWSHSYCETGVPAYSGFSWIGFKNPTDTVYDDGYFLPVTNGSTGNYIVTTVMNDCLESFADSVKTISFVVGIKENDLLLAGLEVFPNPFSNNLQVDLKALTFSQIESKIYSVDGKILKVQVDKNCKGILNLRYDDLKPGIYFLHLSTESGTLVKKLVKEQ